MKKNWKRSLSLILTVTMIAGTAGSGYAGSSSSIDTNSKEAVVHEHDESCYSYVEQEGKCTHKHTAECYDGADLNNVGIATSSDCTLASDSNAKTMNCKHVHDEQCGGVIRKLNCDYENKALNKIGGQSVAEVELPEDNLLRNGGMEDVNDGKVNNWEDYNKAFTFEPDGDVDALEGNSALYATSMDGWWCGPSQWLINPWGVKNDEITAGTYDVSAWVYSEEDTSLRVTITYALEDGNFWGEEGAGKFTQYVEEDVPAGIWTKIEGTVELPDDIEFLQYHVESNEGETKDFYLDAACFVKAEDGGNPSASITIHKEDLKENGEYSKYDLTDLLKEVYSGDVVSNQDKMKVTVELVLRNSWSSSYFALTPDVGEDKQTTDTFYGNGSEEGISVEEVFETYITEGTTLVWHLFNPLEGGDYPIEENFEAELTISVEKAENLETKDRILYLTFDDEAEEEIYKVNGSPEFEEDSARGSKVLGIHNNADDYLTIDGSFLDDREEITISYWSKNEEFKYPNYWAFWWAPADCDVIAWSNEHYIGITDQPGSVGLERFCNEGERPASTLSASSSSDEWKMVTVVVGKDYTNLYINGEQKGTEDSSHLLSEILGTDSTIYLGRANWGTGESFGGYMDDIEIYGYAMNSTEVRSLYTGIPVEDVNLITTEEMQRYFDILTLKEQFPDGAMLESGPIELPTEIGNAAIAWLSSAPDIVNVEDSSVTLPEVGFDQDETDTVTLTAAISYRGETVKKKFHIPVIQADKQTDYFKEQFQIPYALGDGELLPDSYGAGTITWSGAGVSESGLVEAGTTNQMTSITAHYEIEGDSADKDFKVKIFAEDSMKMGAYTRIPVNLATYSGSLSYSMHLAYEANGVYHSLNNNSGILYAKAVVESNGKLNPKDLKNPYVFLLEDGITYGIMAVRTDSSDKSSMFCNAEDTDSTGKVLLFTTEDFIQYQEVGLLDLQGEAAVSDIICEYDGINAEYVINWNDIYGNYYRSVSSDVLDLEIEETAVGSMFYGASPDMDQEDISGRNCFYVPKSTGTRMIARMTQMSNTGVSVPDQIEANSAEDVEAVKAELTYSDGSIAKNLVSWDLSGLNFDQSGTYTITGEVKTMPSMKVNENPLGVQRADPCIYYKDGYYYFIATNDGNVNHNGTFSIRKAESIEELRDAEEIQILSLDDYGDIATMLWAPEIHEIGGGIWILFSTNPNPNPKDNWDVQSHVMKLKAGGDMTKSTDWEKPIRVENKDGGWLNDAGIGGITLDMTTFNVNNTQYVSWSQRNFGIQSGAWLYLATVDANKPWKLTSDPVVISQPDYGWDNNDNTPVNEGPYAIIREDKVFITFSGSSVGATYCVGLVEAEINANLLEKENWTKRNFPLLDPYAVDGELGPGHNSYTMDQDGNLVFVYHARPDHGDGIQGDRTSGLRTVHFDIDGYPVLYLTSDLWVAEEHKTVTMSVVVSGEDNPGEPGDDKDPEEPGDDKDPEEPGDDKDPEEPGDDKDPEEPGGDKDPEKPGEDKDPEEPDDNGNTGNSGNHGGGSSGSSGSRPSNSGPASYDTHKGYTNSVMGIITSDADGYSNWKQDKAGWRLIYADGTGAVITWELVNGAWYYFGGNGYAANGLIFDPVYNGWFLIDINSGMKTGWQLIDGEWYYFNQASDGTQGKMAVNTRINGYYVGETGAWDKRNN